MNSNSLIRCQRLTFEIFDWMSSSVVYITELLQPLPLLCMQLTGLLVFVCYSTVELTVPRGIIKFNTVIFQVIGDHGIFFVVGWELVTFNILHLRESNRRFPWNCLRLPASPCLKSIILSFWPWFAAACILVPLIVTNTPIRIFYNESDDVMCMMSLPRNVLVTVCFFSLYLPFYLCVAALVTVVVCYSKGCHKESPITLMENPRTVTVEETSERHEMDQQTANPDNPLVASVPNTVYLVCYMPLIVHTWLHFSDIHTPNSAYGMIVFGLLARSIILPLSWAVFKDIRQELKEYETKLKGALSLCVSNPPPSTSSAVTFSRLQETV